MDALSQLLTQWGLPLDPAALRAWALGWLRVAPAVALVPALGLRGLPVPARATFALALGASAAPLLGPGTFLGRGSPLDWFDAALSGVAVALVASSSIWIATMAGGLVDDLRGAGQESTNLPVLPTTTPIGALFGLLAGIAYLSTGGPTLLLSALLRTEGVSRATFLNVAALLASGIELAVGIMAPIVAVAVLFEVAGAVIARAAQPASIHTVLSMCRSLLLLFVMALFTERAFDLIVTLVTRKIPVG